METLTVSTDLLFPPIEHSLPITRIKMINLDAVSSATLLLGQRIMFVPPTMLWSNWYLINAKTDYALDQVYLYFDDKAVAISNRILEEIRQGNVSDIVGGPALYAEIGVDQNKLMRYRCSRGTSSVEGSVHFNIIRKFASYNAGPRLTDAVLSDYRLYHNISMGSITRHGKVHNWHFSPWISQAINTLRVKLGHDPIKNYFGNRIELARKYEMQPLDYATSNFSVGVTLSRKRLFDSCILPVVKLPYIDYSGKHFLYRFLSHCQGTAFAVTAVHTKEETELFDNLLVSQRDLITSGNSSNIMFNIFARLWSSYCQAGNSIYYKTEEHLYAYYNILEDRKKYGNTVLMNIDISQFVRSATQNLWYLTKYYNRKVMR
ncbi:hypothetical protein INT47_003562 [Mucor saturninus]|uniref:Uncharacterized protein n=1 Tax=Mucor saturninus TaxID=64648 RepID=A0A8H7QFD6_9FUNG|nr:hypothetical protein INT47_003562 [Mucor saturninus]